MKKVIFALTIVLVTILNLYGFNNYSHFEILKRANNFYENGEYNKAAEFYKKLIKNKNYSNGYIFYNIGTCFLKSNNIGKALFYLNKARFFIPLDRDLIKNLQVCKSKVKDDIADKTIYHYLSGFFFLDFILSLKGLYYFSLFFLYILTILMIIYIFTINRKKKRILKRGIIVTGVFFVFIFSNFLWRYFEYNYLKIGYVIKNSTQLKNDFNESAMKIGLLNDGTKLYIKGSNGNFLHVKLPDGIDGWVLKKNVVF